MKMRFIAANWKESSGRKLFEDYASLCRYELSVREHLPTICWNTARSNRFLHSLMYLGAGNPEEYLFSLPAF